MIRPPPLSWPSVEAWAQARVADVRRREYRRSLDLSPEKPLGFLGFPNAFVQIFAILWWVIRHPNWSREKYLYLFCSWPDRADVKLYIGLYDGIQAVLFRHRALLEASGWPTEAQAYVAKIAGTMVRPMTPLYDVIADCFGDHTSPARTDVLPEITDRGLLLVAYRQATATTDLPYGEPDPSIVYWEGRGTETHDAYILSFFPAGPDRFAETSPPIESSIKEKEQ